MTLKTGVRPVPAAPPRWSSPKAHAPLVQRLNVERHVGIGLGRVLLLHVARSTLGRVGRAQLRLGLCLLCATCTERRNEMGGMRQRAQHASPAVPAETRRKKKTHPPCGPGPACAAGPIPRRLRPRSPPWPRGTRSSFSLFSCTRGNGISVLAHTQ